MFPTHDKQPYPACESYEELRPTPARSCAPHARHPRLPLWRTALQRAPAAIPAQTSLADAPRPPPRLFYAINPAHRSSMPRWNAPPPFPSTNSSQRKPAPPEPSPSPERRTTPVPTSRPRLKPPPSLQPPWPVTALAVMTFLPTSQRWFQYRSQPDATRAPVPCPDCPLPRSRS